MSRPDGGRSWWRLTRAIRSVLPVAVIAVVAGVGIGIARPEVGRRAPDDDGIAATQVPGDAAVPASVAGAEVRAVEVTPAGDLWISVRDRGIGRLRDDGIDWITVDDGLVSTGIADLHEDRSGRLWAVGLGGFSVREGGRWVSHRAIGDLQPRVVFSVYEAPGSGAVWLAASGGAGRLLDDEWAVVRESDGLPHAVVHAVVVDRDGVTWLACRTGLARMEAGQIEVRYSGINFRTALVGADGALWFGTSDGVYRWDGNDWTRYLQGMTVYTRLVADDGAIWAGSASDGVFRYAAGTWRAIELPARLQGAEVFDLAQAPDGAIWLATAAGLGRLAQAR